MQLALAGESHASVLPEEEYWETVWPNTPIPNSLRDLLKPGPQGWLQQLYIFLVEELIFFSFYNQFTMAQVMKLMTSPWILMIPNIQ